MSVEAENEIDGGSAETSLRDDLRTALTEIQTRESTAEEIGKNAQETTDKTRESTAEEITPARTDGRNDRGQFAGKPKEAAEAAPADAAPADGAAPAAEAETAPKSWRQDEAAEWANMSPKARDAVQRREREIATIIGRQDNERLFGKEMADIFRPHADEISQAGATPQAALQLLLKNHNSLRSNNPQEKIATARRLMFEYGIDPSLIAQPDPNMPQDPHVQHLMRQVQQLTHQLTNRGQQQQFTPLPEPVSDGNVSPDIEAFRTDPAHPHFDHVAGHMAGLIESGAAPDLETAYQMAVSANPTLRSTAPADPAPETQRSNEVAAARRASVSVTGSPGEAGTPKAATLRDELRNELRRHGIAG